MADEYVTEEQAPEWWQLAKKLDLKYNEIMLEQQRLKNQAVAFRGTPLEPAIKKQIVDNGDTIGYIEKLRKTLAYSWDKMKVDFKSVFNIGSGEIGAFFPVVAVAVSGAVIATAIAMITARLTESGELQNKIATAAALKSQGFTDAQITEIIKPSGGGIFGDAKTMVGWGVVGLIIFYGGKIYLDSKKRGS